MNRHSLRQLIFQFAPNSTSPSFSTISSSIQAVGLKNGSNSASNGKIRDNSSNCIIEISQSTTAYKLNLGRIYIIAAVSKPTSSKSVKLSILNDQETSHNSETDSEAEAEDTKNPWESQQTNILNPTLIFTLLKQLYTVYSDYCGTPLKASKIEENYDVLSNVTQDFFQSGHPFITDINMLKENTPNRESLGSKIINTTSSIAKSYGPGSNLSLSSLTSQVSGSVGRASSASGNSTKFKGSSSQSLDAVPWRKAGIRYTNNELFLDITETLNVVLATPSSSASSSASSSVRKSHNSKTLKTKAHNISNNNLHPRYATITGQVDFRSTLSGIPHVQLVLNLNGHNLNLPALHQSINKTKFKESEGSILSFIPPDGKFKLMDYVLDIDSYPHSKLRSKNMNKSLGLVEIQYNENLGLRHNEFEIKLNLPMNVKINSVQGLRIGIKSNFKEDDQTTTTVKVLRVSHGDFQIKGHDKYEWVFDEDVKLGINPILRCIIESEDDDHQTAAGHSNVNTTSDPSTNKASFPKEISLHYSHKGGLASGIRVESLNILKGFNDAVKPFKGVKYSTKTGEFVIR
ncbi:hypothetical protein WICPIJ_009598 [Wickerhamomyces pijperi]|uniref:MHD domain-containing protein n=1 Tax=Wickerhamomyces pijperi TaxID=599730 RepID=A0A9P8PLW6_WICPI|nr:hypothetical protein WICPIJ_009598 [Wickerhamomyces pijperi]